MIINAVNNYYYYNKREKEIRGKYTSEQEYIQEIKHFEIEVEVVKELHAKVNKLPPECKKVFHLFYWQEKTSLEIAKQLGIAQMTVRNQLKRGRQLLRNMYQTNDNHLR